MDGPSAKSLGIPSCQEGMICPMCGLGVLIRRHCKSICERCGYIESCEDNFLPTRVHPLDAAMDSSTRRTA